MIEGKAVYDEEIRQIKDDLKAEGIVLIVIGGKKNTSDIEFGSALKLFDIARIISVLRRVADTFESDLKQILENQGNAH